MTVTGVKMRWDIVYTLWLYDSDRGENEVGHMYTHCGFMAVTGEKMRWDT